MTTGPAKGLAPEDHAQIAQGIPALVGQGGGAVIYGVHGVALMCAATFPALRRAQSFTGHAGYLRGGSSPERAVLARNCAKSGKMTGLGKPSRSV